MVCHSMFALISIELVLILPLIDVVGAHSDRSIWDRALEMRGPLGDGSTVTYHRNLTFIILTFLLYNFLIN